MYIWPSTASSVQISAPHACDVRTLPAEPSPEPPFRTFCINNLNSLGQDLAAHHHREWWSVDTTWPFMWNLNYAHHSLQLRWHIPFGGPGLTWESCNVSVTFLWLQWKSWPRQLMERSSYSSRGVRVHHDHGKNVVEQAGSAWGSELRTQLLNSKQKANANWPKKKNSLSSLKLTPSDICQPARPNLLKLPNQNHQLVTEHSSDQD